MLKEYSARLMRLPALHPVVAYSAWFVVASLLALPGPAVAHGVRSTAFSEAAEPAQPSGADVLRVFLDCGPCDDDYLRREIPTPTTASGRPSRGA